MRKKISLGVVLALLFVVAALTVSVTMLISMRYFSQLVGDVGKQKAMYDYLNEIDKAARQNYTIDETKLKQALAAGYINGLSDPYASFLTSEQFAQQQNARTGVASDFGLVLASDREDRIVVVLVHESSSAAQSGIVSGDIILAVNGEQVTGKQLTSVQKTLASSSKVILSVRRGENELAVELTASVYNTTSVVYKTIDNVGYIRFLCFHDQTARQFKTALNALLSQGVTGLVFDVRGCVGTNSESVRDVLAYLLPSGVYARYITRTGTTDLLADASFELHLPSVTLTDLETEGEAELFAAVLQDFHKTYVVGTVTRGKNTVQKSFVIASDNTAVHLSVGRYALVSSAEWLRIDASASLSQDALAYREFLTLEEDTVLSAGLRYLQTGTVETKPATTTTTTTTTTVTETGETTATVAP